MKRYLLGLLIAIGCFGQSTGSNVVASFSITSRTLAAGGLANYLCSTVTCTAGTVIQNIGQTNHQVTISATTGVYDGTGRISCTMEASTNGTHWFNIGIPANPLIWTSSVASLQVKCNGFGSYPYLRTNVTVQALTATSITFSALYEGNSIPSNTLIDLSGSMTNMRNRANGPLVTGAVKTVIVTGTGTNSLSLYSIAVKSDNTGTLLEIGCSLSGTPDSEPFIIAGLELVPTTGLIRYPLGIRPLLTCKPGWDMYYSLTGTPVASIYYHFRNE